MRKYTREIGRLLQLLLLLTEGRRPSAMRYSSINSNSSATPSANSRTLREHGLCALHRATPRSIMAGMPLFAHAGRGEKLTPPPFSAPLVVKAQG